MAKFESLEELLLATAEAVRPPERLTVAEAAEKYRWINNPGSYVGPFRNDKIPYMTEPMEVLTSLDYTGMIFVGPAQCAKTDLALNWITHSAVCDPGDMMVIDKSQTSARDFYQRRLEKLYRDTPEVKTRLVPGQKGTSTYSSKFTSGMLLTLSWPTVNELSGKPIGRLWLADYDRMDEDIGGEGSPYDLAAQRMKSFKRFGMCAAESSPSRNVENPRWMAKSPHQAPPTTGILALYNRGDRRRYYWRCVSCGHGFEPCFTLMRWPDTEDKVEAAEGCYMGCPHCGQVYTESADAEHGIPGKFGMNLNGRWLRDGERMDPETGNVVGEPVARARVASFWLKGPAAAFADWSDMTLKYLKALEEMENTGSEEALQTTVNTDQGLPYLPKGLESDRLPEDMKARARDYGHREVPEGVRYLIATVDVQKRRFEVQVHGFGVKGESWVIDRFKIRKSDRLDEEGDPLPLNPGGYKSDWHLLTEQVALKTYPLADESGRHMQIKFIGVDSGGSEGVTTNAYAYWLHLQREDNRGLHRRLHLIKGDPRKEAPIVRIDYPDAERKDRKAAARGEVPVMFLASNKLKDAVDNLLTREEPGPGYVHFPSWLEDWWFAELCAETKTTKGVWDNSAGRRNEAWDLLCYAHGVAQSSKVRAHLIDWDNPPGWADEWDRNDLVTKGENLRFQLQPKRDIDLSELARKLG